MTDEVKSTWDEVLEDFEMVMDKLQLDDESDRAILTMGAFHCFSQGFWRGLERVFDSDGPPIA
tara:strand:- start:138 stop:326 length:189 start_codon:yes stop_codon:yes gene_type:complete